MKKLAYLLIPFALVLVLLLSKSAFKEDVALTGHLVFDRYDYENIYSYNLSTGEMKNLEVEGFANVSDVTGYTSQEISFFCVGSENGEYYLLSVTSGRVADSWKLSEKPLKVKAVNGTVIIALSDSVQILNCAEGDISVLLENVTVDKIIAYESSFVLWAEDSHYVGKAENGRVTIGGKISHDTSLKATAFVDENTLLTYTLVNIDKYFYNLSADTMTECDYDIDDTIPMLVSGDKILCLYETNYTNETRWYVYEISKDKMTAVETDVKLLSADDIEWVK